MVCYKTLSEQQGGIIPNGCCSSSGFGDGNYPLDIAKDNKECVGIRVEFFE